jgi:23S rRNA (guanine745-N1)-methyltransferase
VTSGLVVCPVRACGADLELGAQTARCPRGHAFDRARSGYWNLLQPQDRRAKQPGDAAEVTEARRRTLARGLGDALVHALATELGGLRSPVTRALVDVGCGDGFFLAALCRLLDRPGVGVDLSARAIDLAARHSPGPLWLVANADRRLPIADGQCAAVLSVTGPKHSAEFRRLLAEGGRLLVVVPAPDDLVELRAAVLGPPPPGLDRTGRMVEMFKDCFSLERSTRVASRARLARDALADLLASSYRAGRRAPRERLSALPVSELEVTLSWDLLTFAPRS